MRKIYAFTLVEMLIVIVIIGVLSTALIPKILGIQSRARDTARINHFSQIQSALSIYYLDNNSYPLSGPCYATDPNTSWCNSAESIQGGYWIGSGALEIYLKNDPIDPSQKSSSNFYSNQKGGNYYYYAGSHAGCINGQFYMLIGGMEVGSNNKNQLKGCNGTVGSSVYAAGGSYFVGGINGN